MKIQLALCAFIAMAAPAAAAEVKADIKLFQFQPKEIMVKPGDSITWLNGDDIEHSVTAGKPGKETKQFDSGFFTKDGTFTQAFSEAGTIEYFCKRHPSMKGKIVIAP
jgi:plastocyanin